MNVSTGLALLLVCYCTGVLCATGTGISFSARQIFVLLLLCIIGAWGYIWQKSKFTMLILLLGTFWMGLILGAASWHGGDALRTLQGKKLIINGTVDVASIQQRPDGISLELQAEEIVADFVAGSGEQTKQFSLAKAVSVGNMSVKKVGESASIIGRIRIFMKRGQERWPGQIYHGRFQVTGELRPLTGLANPGTRDSEMAARVAGLSGHMSIGMDQAVRLPGRQTLWTRLQRLVSFVRVRALDKLPSREGPLLLSMTLGGYRGLDEDVVATFRNNGLAHLLAVSGTHVAFLTALALAVTRTWPRSRQKVFVAGLNMIYAAACGLAPAVVRAVLCSLVLLAGQGPQQRAHRGRLLAGVAFIILVVKPLWLLDVSFQLSFVTVAGLIWVLPKLQLYIPMSWPGALREPVAVTLTAQLVSFPIVVWYFHQVSVIALVSNLLLLPALVLALLCFIPGLLLCPVVPVLAQLCFYPAVFLVRGALAAGNILTLCPVALLSCRHWGWWRTGAYYLFMAVWLTPGWCSRLSYKIRRIMFFLSVCIFVGVGLWQEFRPIPLTVYHFDVGQGDAALIMTPDRQNFLLDTGGLGGDYDVGEKVIVPALRYLGVRQLDGLFLSHGDHDHAGGAAAIVNTIPVRHIYRGTGGFSDDEKRMFQVLKQFYGPTSSNMLHQLKSGQILKLGKTTVEVLAGSEAVQTTNESSLILRFKCAERKLLFTGDAPGTEELTTTGEDVEAELLKVSHHGSRSSSEPVFLQRVQPRIAVISVGRDNLYGHPAPEVVLRLQKNGILVLRTDLLGALKVVFDGSSLKWYSYRYQPREF